MTLQDIAQQMCRMKECEEFPLKWKTDVERMIFNLNAWAEIAVVMPKAKWLDADGRPTKHQYSVTCSNCNKWSEYRDNYCGYCGAKMDDDEEEN